MVVVIVIVVEHGSSNSSNSSNSIVERVWRMVQEHGTRAWYKRVKKYLNYASRHHSQEFFSYYILCHKLWFYTMKFHIRWGDFTLKSTLSQPFSTIIHCNPQ